MTATIRAFRIADNRFPLMDGGGAFRMGGRWNSKGRYVIYAGIGFATAMLEKLAHTRIGRIPTGQHYAVITIPESVSVETLDPAALPGWDRMDHVASRAFGDEWYDSKRTAALIVPSAPAMGLERNLLINQLHPEFMDIKAERPVPVIWDQRLFGTDG
ncbi:RES domain-containing protein [Niveispirillum sp.]|uniref:RES family NAD+ phosphorylase n=1 Tax=Niveispirillum sp. TaxID=1917217 RepID=UPI001B5862CE|nr:RES domain-containing protein [Niveispirillum sp.]MBP7337553.1 RES domain-containing protein [Niveispirillum sp.]